MSRFFLGDFLVLSLPVCDGGMLEFLLVFLGDYQVLFRSNLLSVSNNLEFSRWHKFVIWISEVFAPKIAF